MRFEHQRALKLFEQNGCQVDYDAMRVRMPSCLVEECLRKAPSSYYIKARDPESDVQLGGNTLYFGATCGMGIVDLDTLKLRPATTKERDDGCVVIDALENLHHFGAYSPHGRSSANTTNKIRNKGD